MARKTCENCAALTFQLCRLEISNVPFIDKAVSIKQPFRFYVVLYYRPHIVGSRHVVHEFAFEHAMKRSTMGHDSGFVLWGPHLTEPVLILIEITGQWQGYIACDKQPSAFVLVFFCSKPYLLFYLGKPGLLLPAKFCFGSEENFRSRRFEFLLNYVPHLPLSLPRNQQPYT